MRRSLLVFTLLLGAARLAAQGTPAPKPGSGAGPDDWARHFFPPEMVMQNQGEIGLQDSQRAALSSAVQLAQGKMMEVQWKVGAEAEKLSRLIEKTQIDEAQVLEQVDRILGFEREIKKAQVTLLVRIKNTLTPAQQAKLAEIRGRTGREE